MHYRLMDTPIGPVGVAWTGRGLARLQLPERDAGATERRLLRGGSGARPGTPTREAARAIAAVERYLAGERVDLSAIALDLDGVGEFHRRIYAVARRIEWGKTTTYGALARQAGCPDAARAVGQAMGRNPVPIVIPCHRVLAAGDRVGGFSAFGGADAKRRLLALEGVRLAGDAPLLPGLEPVDGTAKPIGNRLGRPHI
jgi:methylated-DNA-[protein]-cysteine S-methyltransferase